jgi:hypothetical protein
MALRATPHQPIRTPHRPMRSAQPLAHPVLGALSNLAGMSGGTPSSGGGGGAAGGGGGGGGAAQPPWQSDPVLQQITQLQQANLATAEAHALAARKEALINYGYDENLQSLYGDQGTQGSAQANPFSVLAQLAHTHEQRQTNLNQALNKANLYYSSYRGQQLGQEGQQYLGERAAAAQGLRSTLGGLSDAEVAAQQNAQNAIAAATQDAYQRYLDQQLKYGLGQGATATGGGGGGRTATPLARPRVTTRGRGASPIPWRRF